MKPLPVPRLVSARRVSMLSLTAWEHAKSHCVEVVVPWPRGSMLSLTASRVSCQHVRLECTWTRCRPTACLCLPGGGCACALVSFVHAKCVCAPALLEHEGCHCTTAWVCLPGVRLRLWASVPKCDCISAQYQHARRGTGRPSGDSVSHLWPHMCHGSFSSRRQRLSGMPCVTVQCI